MVLWQGDDLRVIAVSDANYPGYCRVIWNEHVREMTDLNENDRIGLMRVVFVVESGLRVFLRPAKINLASLGNQVPHLHWHVIPRFEDDPCFPGAIWAPPVRVIGNARSFDWSAFAAWLNDQLGQSRSK
jgi:diadenosine tetraphosphate (Ap4A) HIT family hydrolase